MRPIPDLHRLLMDDPELRAYFLSFPVSVQLTAHRENDFLHSAADVRAYLSRIAKREPDNFTK